MYFYSIGQCLAKCWPGASLLASLGCPVSAAAVTAADSSKQDG